MVAPTASHPPRTNCISGWRSFSGLLSLVLFGVLCVAIGRGSAGATIDDVDELFRTGQYDECAALAGKEIAKGAWGERWPQLKFESELARGKIAEARTTLEDALRRFPMSLSLRLIARDFYRSIGLAGEAKAELEFVERLVAEWPERFTSPEARLALGRFFLLRGADPRKVLDRFYDVARKEQPSFVDAYFATAELALQKQDDALAAETLRKAPDDAAEDPKYHELLARAYSGGDRAQAEKQIAEALRINPHHAPSLRLQADHLIDDERYEDAEKTLKLILADDPDEPRAWAYRAVLAHLRNDRDAENASTKKALKRWPGNPEVDHIFGRKLSQKYRFAEGAAAQRRALEKDPEYQPSRIQLCQDLLRLGDESEGWKLAAAVFADDPYNVVAFNLIELRDHLAKFRTLEGDGVLVRMDPREAELYGPRVVSLLQKARKTLGEKYGARIEEPVVVEIFPQRRDFAVRTFGLPGADGLLGVCFGRVVTANSPASQAEHPANWEAVLWHEYCHSVTLAKTRNKMPRWLSEGISVYEEGRADGSWAEPMSPRFRAMILGKELTPLSRLSAAFLAPPSGLHLQFAYFESALAVEFFVDRFGLDVLKGMLDDLGAGIPINETLPRRTRMSLNPLDEQFALYARKKAEAVAPKATWEEPDLPADSDSTALTGWLESHPNSFWGLRRLAARLVTEEKWSKAKETLERLKALYPEDTGPENAYVLLAAVARHTSDSAAEKAILEELAARDASASAAFLRLIELDEASKAWRDLAKNARRLLAVNPLIPAPHRALARAAEELGQPEEAVAAYRSLTRLDDADPAGDHYKLAKLLRQVDKPEEARREVLKALEDAPRFQEAHRLLLELVRPPKKAAAENATPGPRGPEGAP